MKLSRTLFAQWILGTTGGLTTGLLLGFWLASPIEALVGMILVTPLILLLAGSVLGTSQWLVIRRYLVGSGWWVLLTTLGLGVGLTLGIVAVEVGGELIMGEPVRVTTTSLGGLLLSFTVVGMLTGLSLGVMQWFYLRRHGKGGGHWILVSMGGFMLAFLIGFLVAEFPFGGVSTPLGFAVFLIVGGLLIGITTAKSLGQVVAEQDTEVE